MPKAFARASSRPLIVGREREQLLIAQAVDRAQTEPVLLTIRGAAGIGKTTLLRETRCLLSDTTKDFAATADGFASDRPFAPLTEAFQIGRWGKDLSDTQRLLHDALSSSQTNLPTALSLAADPRHRIVDAFVAYVDEILTSTPIAIFIEDLHHADISTITTLRMLRARSIGRGLLIVASTRPEASHSTSGRHLDLLASNSDVIIDLTPLDDAQIRVLTFALGGGAPGPILSGVLDTCAGNPLIVTDLLVAAREEKVLERLENGDIELTSTGLPPGFAARVVSRLTALSPATRNLVRAGAVFGNAFSILDVAESLGLRPIVLSDSVQEAIRGGFVVDEGTVLRFRHDLVRDAVLGDLPAVVRSALHTDAAGVLARRSASPTIVLAHLEASGSADRHELCLWHLRAARDLVWRSPTDAVPLFNKALLGLSSDDPLYWQLRVELFGAVANGGPIETAERLGRELIAEALPDELANQVRWWMGGLLMLMNRLTEAGNTYLDLAETSSSPSDRGQLLALASMTRHAEMDPSAIDLAHRAREMGELLDDHFALSVSLSIESREIAASGRFLEGLRTAEFAVQAAENDHEFTGHRYQVGLMLALSGLDCCQFDVCADAIALSRRRNAEMGIPWSDAIFHGVSAVAGYMTGKLDSCLAEAQAGIDLARDSGVSIALLWCLSTRALALQHLGLIAEAESTLRLAEGCLATGGQMGLDILALAQGRVIGERKGPEAALDHLESTWDLFDVLPIEGLRLSTVDETIRLAALVNRPAAAVRVGKRSMQWFNDTAAPEYRCRAELVAALAANHIVGALTAAQALDELGTVPLSTANAFEVATHLAHRLTNLEQTRSAARRSAQLYEQVGAYGDATRMTDLLRTLGGRPRKARARHGWTSLTATERLVAQGICDGLSNRDIGIHIGIGVRTVESHVSSVLRKLEARSRTQVAAFQAQA